MKNKLMIAGLILTFVLGFAYASNAAVGPVTAQESATAVRTQATYMASESSQAVTSRHPVGNKAARGIKNILFGWTEVPKRVVDITRETRNPIWGLAAGTFQGAGKGFARTVSGVSDVLSAPIRPNDKPLIQPDMDVK